MYEVGTLIRDKSGICGIVTEVDEHDCVKIEWNSESLTNWYMKHFPKSELELLRTFGRITLVEVK